MNDRYLCRAKRIDNGEFAEGCLIVDESRKGKFKYKIQPIEGAYLYAHPVCPSTICQCTGLKDKNGKLIWEGDICIIRDGTLDEEDGYFRLDWEIDRAMFEFEGPGLCVNFDNVYGYECEVVGNIFDNPELLEREE